MSDMEQLYQQRLKRYTMAMAGKKPDRVPIRPFMAEFCGKYAGYDCQQVTQDIGYALDAVVRTCKDFDWDAAVANMVWVWGGIPQAMGLKYYQIPGVGLGRDVGFNYLEPPEGQSFMQPEDYDAFIEDPTGFLYNVWLPRVSTDVVAPGQPNTYRSNLAMLKGGMSVLSYFSAFPNQIKRMREEAGTVSAIGGILKAPFDILADKLRGYIGLCMDLCECPDKVMKACEALMPHMFHTALTSADPSGTVPIGLWMHRGCVPFVSFDHFQNYYWATLKPIVLELWKRGLRTLFYAEGKWGPHLQAFRELPEGSIVFHCDRDDIFEVKRVLGDKFCISGGVPNRLLAFGTPGEVRECVRNVMQGCKGGGGYIFDAAAIVQNDATVENVKAMTQAAVDFGGY